MLHWMPEHRYILFVISAVFLFVPAQAKILKVVDFETGNVNQPSSLQGKNAVAVTSPVRAGKYAGKFGFSNSGERSEMVPIKQGTLRPATEYWMGLSYYIPSGGNKGIIMQLAPLQGHLHRECFNFKCGNPIQSELKCDANANMSFRVIKGGEYKGKQQVQNCRHFKWTNSNNKWIDIVMNLKLAGPQQGNGFMRIWRNGEKVVDYSGATFYDRKWSCWSFSTVYFKMGMYVGDPGKGNRTIYIDELRIGDASSSYEEVVPGGERPQPSDTPVEPKKLTLPAKISFGAPAQEWVDGDDYVGGGMPFTFALPSVVEGVAGAGPEEMYQSVIHRGESAEPLKIDFPGLANGVYALTFHVADQYGGRAIDIAAEGTKVIEDLDPITEGGGEMKAVVKKATVTVSDGNGLQIELNDDRAEPKDVFLSGLEIVKTGSGVPVLDMRSVRHRDGIAGDRKHYLPTGRRAGDRRHGIVISRTGQISTPRFQRSGR